MPDTEVAVKQCTFGHDMGQSARFCKTCGGQAQEHSLDTGIAAGQCASGHDMGLTAKYCKICGSAVQSGNTARSPIPIGNGNQIVAPQMKSRSSWLAGLLTTLGLIIGAASAVVALNQYSSPPLGQALLYGHGLVSDAVVAGIVVGIILTIVGIILFIRTRTQNNN